MASEGRTDAEFIAALRFTVEQYLKAVDDWESGYRKYYRLPGYSAKVSHDLEPEHRVYLERRKALEEMLPHARRLCIKYRMRDPFSGLVRISLGRYAPQHRSDSAIGRNERNAATACLVDLAAASREPGSANIPPPAEEAETEPKGSWLRRLRDYFY